MTRRKTDANQSAIIRTLESCGRYVVPLCELAQREPRATGVPDLLVGYYDLDTGEGKIILLEVKTAKGVMNKDQVIFAMVFPGPIAVVRNEEDALAATGGTIE